ncbi:MAG: NUDIX hydrolase [Chloroflexi bacterium]|nr:NUDIX hydrolase [Chloroflexota bacterium]
MRRKRRVEDLVSAGGVVYRINGGEPEVVLCGHISPPVWGLPKGTPDRGESREQTALREVREETGLEVEIERFIDSIDYWFVRSSDGVRCHKTVLYYLMSPTGGDVSLHDHEFDEVRWLPAAQAFETMTYEDEVEVVKKALSMVQKAARAG